MNEINKIQIVISIAFKSCGNVDEREMFVKVIVETLQFFVVTAFLLRFLIFHISI